jgi:two-component system, NtrC family, response regulator
MAQKMQTSRGRLNPENYCSQVKTMALVLIIDDDPTIAGLLEKMIQKLGHDARVAHTLEDGLNIAVSHEVDVVFLDVKLPDGNGLQGIGKLKEMQSSPEVIIITALGDPEGAAMAIRNGAWDYIEKPSSLSKVMLPLIRALQYRDARQVREKPLTMVLNGIVGKSAQTKYCIDRIVNAACSDANVLLIGETGTGKDLFAKAIHYNSLRANGRFVTVDCAALPTTLVESELFGHVRGAFTGAERSREGLIKQAHGGTLFLDEIGELDLAQQKNFLRVLQDKRFRPVGGGEEIESNFRLVAATNRDLEKMVKDHQFREDLFFRIRTIQIDIPPLRGRPEDIKDIASHYVKKFSMNFGDKPKKTSPEFLEALLDYSWPGNVRELVHTIERAVTVAQSEPVIYAKHLPDYIRINIIRRRVKKNAELFPISQHGEKQEISTEIEKFRIFRRVALDTIEARYLTRLMELSDGNIEQACQLSGLSRTRLYFLLSKHEVSKGNKPLLEGLSSEVTSSLA